MQEQKGKPVFDRTISLSSGLVLRVTITIITVLATRVVIAKRLVLLLVAVLLVGCDALHGIVGRTAPSPPVVVSVLCDASPGSSCTEDSLASTLDVVLPFVADHPGSRVQVFVMGNYAEETRLTGMVRVGAPPKPSRAARTAFRTTFLASARETLLGSALPFIHEDRVRSPILASIARVQLVVGAKEDHRLIVLSDLRESSEYCRCECQELPTTAVWQSRVRGLLPRGSLGSTRVYLTGVDLRPLASHSCPQPVERYRTLVSLFTTALTDADARVSVHTGVITTKDLED